MKGVRTWSWLPPQRPSSYQRDLLNEQQGEFPIDFRWMDGWMDGWMLVSPSVGEERRGIDRADERRGRGTGRVGMQWVGGHEEGESWGEKERGRGRSGGHSLQCVHPLHSPPSLTHSLSADIKEMGVSKGGWSASETRLVVSHETTLLPAPRRQELQTANAMEDLRVHPLSTCPCISRSIGHICGLYRCRQSRAFYP